MLKSAPSFITAALADHDLQHDPADTSVTAATMEQAQHAAELLLPAGWFTSEVRTNVTNGQHYDNLTFIQVAGLDVGDFTIHREPTQRFSLFCLSDCENGGVIERPIGQFETMEEAVTAIRDDLFDAVDNLQKQVHQWMADLGRIDIQHSQLVLATS